MSKKDNILEILEKLNNNEQIPTREDLGMDKEEYGSLLETMEDDNLITNVTIIRAGIGNPVISTITENIKITIKGIKYLEKN